MPVALLVAVLLVAASPPILLAAVVIDLVAWRRPRLTRFAGLAIVWAYAEVIGVFALFFLWILAGFGLFFHRRFFQDTHYALLAVWLRIAVWLVRVALGLRIETDLEPRVEQGRLIMLARHAGPADSIFLAEAILRQKRHPRIVAKAALQWDPVVDVAANRVPFHFVGQGQSRQEEIAAITKLVEEMEERDTFLIFPEGGNYTMPRWDRAVSSLEERGLDAYAEAAKRMPNVLPPRPGGTFAALGAAPDAEVVFVAHTGTEHVQGAADVWRAVPFEQPLRFRSWIVRPSDRPPVDDLEVTTDWLFRWWAVVDSWIGEMMAAARVRREEGRR